MNWTFVEAEPPKETVPKWDFVEAPFPGERQPLKQRLGEGLKKVGQVLAPLVSPIDVTQTQPEEPVPWAPAPAPPPELTPAERRGGDVRVDGTPKGPGFMGDLRRPDGKVSTELSIGVNIDGKETLIPSLVPTLTKEETDHLLKGSKPTDEIVKKAVVHAKQRMSQGMSPFKEGIWKETPELASERLSINAEFQKIKEDSKKLETDRSKVDSFSQESVDKFNASVNQFNSRIQSAQKRVSDFNAKIKKRDEEERKRYEEGRPLRMYRQVMEPNVSTEPVPWRGYRSPPPELTPADRRGEEVRVDPLLSQQAFEVLGKEYEPPKPPIELVRIPPETPIGKQYFEVTGKYPPVAIERPTELWEQEKPSFEVESIVPILPTLAKAGQGLVNPLEATMGIGSEAAQMYLGGIVLGKAWTAIKGSTWVRMLTNKERALVVQRLEDLLKVREGQVANFAADVARGLGGPPRMEDFEFKPGEAKVKTYDAEGKEVLVPQSFIRVQKKYQDDLMHQVNTFGKSVVPSQQDLIRNVEGYGGWLKKQRSKGEAPTEPPSPEQTDKVVKDLIKEGTLVKEGDGYVAAPQPTPPIAPIVEPPPPPPEMTAPPMPLPEVPPIIPTPKPVVTQPTDIFDKIAEKAPKKETIAPKIAPEGEQIVKQVEEPLPKPEVTKEGVPVSEEGVKWEFVEAERPIEEVVPKFKTSEEAQKAIDDKIDEIMNRGVSFEVAQTYPEVEELFRARDDIDREDLAEWRKVALKDTGLPEEEAKGAFEQLGLRPDEESGLAISMTAKTLKEFSEDTTINLKALYNYFSRKEPRTFADFKWGGTADNPVLQGTVYDEDGALAKWNEEALKKTEAVYNAIAKTQSLESIDLSRMPRGIPGKKPVEKVEEKPINYDSLFNRFKAQVSNQSTDYFEIEGHKIYKVEEIELPKGIKGTGLGSTNDAEGNIYLRKDLSRQGFQKALDHELRHHKEKGFEETVKLEDMVAKPKGLEARKAEISQEPPITIDQLEKNPALADYILKRKKIHSEDVIKRAEEIKGKGLGKKPVEEKVEPKLSPTAKDQFALPGIKQGIEMKGAKEGVTPTLEGTPLGEAVRKAEIERVQPRLPMGEAKILDPEVEGTIRELQGIIKAGEAGGVLAEGIGRYGSSMQIQSMLGGMSAGKEETLKAIDKGLNGEKLGLRQQQIFDRIKETANGIIDDRIDSLTKSADDEIMGWKEEMRGEGIPEEDITRAVEEATKAYQEEGGSPDLEAIKKELTKEPTKETPSELKTEIPSSKLSTEASVGTYNVGGGGAATGRPKEPPGRMVNIVEMPEMVELFNKLSQGKYPTIKERLRAFHGLAQGLYRTGKGKIELRADIFADPAQAKATFAHEIFHFIDDLPDYMLKQRGNIFGRIASLKGYMKKYLEGYEGAPGPLTEEDKKRLMKDAREALKLEKAEAEEQVAAFKDIKLLPEDIKAIWNDVEARSKNKPVYDFIVSLSEVEKNQIVREAMRGIVSEANQRRFRISMPIEGRPFKDWDQRLRDIFNGLVNEELEKRQVFTYDTVMSELKNLSMLWKPFTPIPGDKFTKYRFSPAELYADAGSVLLNNPALLADKAPSFYKAFFNYIHRKPEVKQVYDDIQARIGMGEEGVLANRRTGVRDMFTRGEKELIELGKPEPWNILYNLRKSFVSKREGLLKLKRQTEKRGVKLDPEKNPDYWTEELPYISGPILQMVRDVNNDVLKVGAKKGIDQLDIGEYLTYRREATERAKMANPKGFTEADALKQMDFLKKELGDEKFNALTDLVKKTWEIRKDNVFPPLEKSRAFDHDTMDLIKNNENYATFEVMDHLENKYGPNMTAKIYRQIGTLKEIVNPLTATVMKDMSLIRMAERKMIGEKVVNFLKEYHPSQITPAETRWNGKYKEIKDPSDPKLGMIAYTHEGKMTGYYVPKDITSLFDKDPYDFKAWLQILGAVQAPLKAILVSDNPGWWVWNTLWRDPKALVKQIPGMTAWKALKGELKAIPSAYKDVFKGVSTDDVRNMYKIKALGVGRYWASSELGPESLLDKIAQSFGETPAKYQWEVLDPYQQLWSYLQAGESVLSNIGGVGERLPKIATYKFLKENTKKSDKEIAHLVRKMAGSPDFWEQGGLNFLYNNALLFSNAGKEGIRSAIEAAKNDPADYIWKTVKYDFIPKLMMFLAGAGVLGGALKTCMDNIPERDKANYLTIPVGLTADDKTAYFVMPHDFQGQIVMGLMWKIMRLGKGGPVTDVVDYMAGGLPYSGVNPLLIGVPMDWTQYITGRNPYDSFRGKYVIPETVFEAGGKESLKEMAKYTSNQLGGGIAYRFKGKNAQEVKSELEKILGLPVVGNILSRFLRVSDAGRKDEYRLVSESIRQGRAQELVAIDNAIKDWINENTPTVLKNPKALYVEMVKDKTIQRHTYDQFLDRLLKSYGYKVGSPEYTAILGAKSNEEKAAIILKIQQKSHIRQKKSVSDFER